MARNLKSLIDEYIKAPSCGYSDYEEDKKLMAMDSFQSLANLSAEDQAALAVLVCDLIDKPSPKTGLIFGKKVSPRLYENRLRVLLVCLFRRKQPFGEEQMLAISRRMAELPVNYYSNPQAYYPATLDRYLKAGGTLTDALLSIISAVEQAWSTSPEMAAKWTKKLRAAIGEGGDGSPPALPLKRNGEIFADCLLNDLAEMTEKQQDAWAFLLAHAAVSDGGKPSKKWEKEAAPLMSKVTKPRFIKCLCNWLPKINEPAANVSERAVHYSSGYTYTPDPMAFVDEHLAVLKGIVWMSGLIDNDDLTRVIGAAGISAYKKIPGVGPRATRVGNACVWALGNIGSDSALAQLALMKVKIKFGTAQKSIEKAMQKLALKLGVSTDELEEISVPEYGLTEVGRLEENFGDYRAVLEVTGRKPALCFYNPDGKAMKSVPAFVKNNFADELKELRGNAKDLEKMLSAQRERLDNFFLQEKTWSVSDWRERYLDHPVVGTLARRLIWTLESASEIETAIWYEGTLVKCDGSCVELIPEMKVCIWHPIISDPKEVLAWRSWLFEHLIQQPFKQAHREVYLLTDAERNTRIYSNRFASHILKQHQFSSLCAVRGWKNQLRLMVDDEYYPACRNLPNWGLRAEFWIEGIGDDYTDEYVLESSGAYRYLSTDQVRFYPIDSGQLTAHAGGGGYGQGYGTREIPDPVPMEQIPPLVLSEILRDVDLFVGVTSVGNDANWNDGGPEGHYRDYWHAQSFGDLGETAEMRKEILATLLPRLKIAEVTEIKGKFIYVRGQLRTYKIHLGSGNILMEPNDQYLCIVKAPQTSGQKKVFLPFEGDGKLSVVLSKAFLLAADTKITDSTILSQINRK